MEPIEIIAQLGLPTPKGVLQVGASSGQELDYFFAHGIRHGAFIEPLEQPFRVLQARCAKSPDYLPVQALCGSTDGAEVSFHVASNNGESSSLLKPARHLSDYTWVRFPEVSAMTTFTLDTIFRAVKAQKPDIAAAIDMLFMDVQGAELHVLKGANAVLHDVRYLYTEVGLGGGYEGDIVLADLIRFLKLYGFDIYNLEMNVAGWGNALFIRRSPGSLQP